jgi:hypothetical protein
VENLEERHQQRHTILNEDEKESAVYMTQWKVPVRLQHFVFHRKVKGIYYDLSDCGLVIRVPGC